MTTTKVNPYHTEIACAQGTVSVNTLGGIQLDVELHHEAGFGTFIDLRREEAQELVRVLTEALQ